MKVIKFAPGLIPVLKHGEHDQSTHGSWANGAISNVQSNPIPNDKLSSGVIRGETITADITVESKTFKLSQTNEKYDDGVITMNLTVKNSDGKIVALMGTSNQFVKNYEYAIITGIQVATQYQRQGIATTMLTFARKHSVEGIKIEHDKNRLSAEGRAWSEVVKHGEHDQSTHGNWATGTPQGGNNLSHREIYSLMAGQPDPKKAAVYKAEEKHSPQIQRKLEKPFPPNGRGEYATREEYDVAYKKYAKAFDEWSRETSRNIQSDSAKATLDGTRAGVQKYIDTVTKADWFVEAFGRGGSVGIPKVALRDSQTAGTYTIGTKNGQPYSAMVINKGYSLNEPTILHEITHYATAISAVKAYQPHGVEFAKNHVYIANKVIGSEYASGLEKAYREEGIDLGN